MSEQYVKQTNYKGAYLPQIMKHFPAPPNKKEEHQKQGFFAKYFKRHPKRSNAVPFGESDILNRPQPDYEVPSDFNQEHNDENIPPMGMQEITSTKNLSENIPPSSTTPSKVLEHLPKIKKTYETPHIARDLVYHIIEIAMEATTFSKNSMTFLDVTKPPILPQVETPSTKNEETQENGYLEQLSTQETNGILQLNRYNTIMEVQDHDDMEEIEEDIKVERNRTSGRHHNSEKRVQKDFIIRKQSHGSLNEIISTKESETHHHQAINKFKEHLDRAEKTEPEDQDRERDEDLAILKAELKKQKPFKDEVEPGENLKDIISKGRNSCASLIDDKCNIY